MVLTTKEYDWNAFEFRVYRLSELMVQLSTSHDIRVNTLTRAQSDDLVNIIDRCYRFLFYKIPLYKCYMNAAKSKTPKHIKKCTTIRGPEPELKPEPEQTQE